jgi:hypothetical protein
MESTSRDIFQPKSHLRTEKLSYMTLPSEMKLAGDKTFYSPTSTVSPGSFLPSSCQTESNPAIYNLPLSDPMERRVPKLNSVTDSTLSTGVGTRQMIADSNMHARNASALLTGRSLATLKKELTLKLRPKYLRHNIWEDDDYFSKSSADWSETAKPLPQIPEAELANPVVTKTIAENPHLFDIVTPINVDRFEKLLLSHPNQPFVKSVCRGLREGFWPWADTHIDEYPDSLDLSFPIPDDVDEAQFLRDQRDHEIFKGRFSEAFGDKLLPGMYCMPIFAIPKPHSTDLRMVTHQSAGTHSLNSMIPRDDIVGYPLDNLRHLGEFLLSMHRHNPDTPRVLFKSDVAEAYRLLPVHPYWQIKQVNRIDGLLHVDRNSAFGGRASGCNWISFMSLVSWIAKKKRNIELLATYSDDSFGPEDANNITWYQPYRKVMPSNQAKMLQLWDEINIPHKEKKQVSGSLLTVIGIEVDANALTMTMPQNSLRDLISAITDFTTNRRRFTLKEWQRLAGWFNWSLNVFPLLRPALNNVYAKISGKNAPNRTVRINNAVRADLTWAINHLERDSGIRLIQQIHWDVSSADFTIYCDACLEGMGFWIPDESVGFYSPVPEHVDPEQIFYFEALCVLSALHHIIEMHNTQPLSRILIYTDNDNTVAIFNTLRCLPHYNSILISAADALINEELSLRVLHIPGDLNFVADAISRNNFALAEQHVPGIFISSFTPPRLTLGAAQK